MCTTDIPINPDISDELHKIHIRSGARNRLKEAKNLIEDLGNVLVIEQFLEIYDDLLYELESVRNAVNHVKSELRAELPLNDRKGLTPWKR
jgi:hypothetical protein